MTIVAHFGAILFHVLRGNHSDILAISASMTFHILAVREVIAAVRLASRAARILADRMRNGFLRVTREQVSLALLD